jgi:hypothetical protein
MSGYNIRGFNIRGHSVRGCIVPVPKEDHDGLASRESPPKEIAPSGPRRYLSGALTRGHRPEKVFSPDKGSVPNQRSISCLSSRPYSSEESGTCVE